jgi:5-methylthioadenosine/S-adenosylhomocysteine deaminase
MSGASLRTLIRHATIVTGDPARTVIHEGALVIEGERIAAVGRSDELSRQYPDATIVDGRGRAVFPGLVNCHTHLCLTAWRGIQEDFGFPSTLRFPVTVRALMSQEENAVFAMLGAVEALRSGNTALLEIGRDTAGYADTLVTSGLRLVLADTAYDLEYDGVPDGRFVYSAVTREAALQRSTDLLARWHGAEGGRVTCYLGPLAPEACSPELLRGTRRLAEQAGTGYTIHLNESRWEVDSVVRVRGLRPTEYVFHQGFLGPRLVAGHCRFMQPSEIALLGQSGAFVSYNSAMAARRGVAPPIAALEAAGCTIAVGSDNMAEDMIEVIRAALFIERVARQDALRPQPEDVLEWATRHGARALGLGDRVGSLEVGKQADLFVVNARHANLVPTLRIVSALVHNGHPGNVESVMVAGRWLMRDGKVLTIDEADVVERADEIGRRAWRQLVERYPDIPFPVRLPPLIGSAGEDPRSRKGRPR